jgi:hypothetical protein
LVLAPPLAAVERPNVVVGVEHAEPVSAKPVRTIYANEVVCAALVIDGQRSHLSPARSFGRRWLPIAM